MNEPSADDNGSLPEGHEDEEPRLPLHGDPEPDQAWKALGLVNDWIKHADAKVGATLAASGAIAILLYNLLKEQDDLGGIPQLFAALCAAATAAAGGCAGLALMPRLTLVSKIRQFKALRVAKAIRPTNSAETNEPPKGMVAADDATVEPPLDDPVNLLFFSSIAREYDRDGPSYVEVFRSLTSDPERLTRQIAHQVHANATVAHRKFAWADRAIKFLVLALLLLGLVAVSMASQRPASGQVPIVDHRPDHEPPICAHPSQTIRLCSSGHLLTPTCLCSRLPLPRP